MARKKSACTHYWKCGEQMGGIVPAYCIRCGAERTFEAKIVDFNPSSRDSMTERQRAIIKGYDPYYMRSVLADEAMG